MLAWCIGAFSVKFKYAADLNPFDRRRVGGIMHVNGTEYCH
jgi:hypothetical protein